MLSSVLATLLLSSTVLSSPVWIPESNGDWTTLRPDLDPLPNSFGSVPFSFGIVVNPYQETEDGELEVPPVSTIARLLTTVFTTSVVTAAPKPTKVADIVQILDGQVQRVNVDAEPTDDSQVPEEEECEDEEEVLIEETEENSDSLDKRHDEECCDDDEEEEDKEFVSPVYAVACATNTTLQMTLQDTILRDSNNRIGSIVSGHQFQFDGPVPQHGAIYAAGWYITEHAQLALGNSTEFYQCASGDFYNLYHEPIGLQCNPVVLDVVELIEC